MNFVIIQLKQNQDYGRICVLTNWQMFIFDANMPSENISWISVPQDKN